MKNTLRQVFHSSKFLVGFIIFLLIVLMVWLYPLFINPGNPLEMIGVGTFAKPGTYVSLYDAVNTRTETLRLPDADAKRVSYLLSDADRAAMLEWFALMEIDVSELDATDTDALLDLWFEHYDPAIKIKGMTMARRNFFKRLDKSVRQIRSADTLKVMHPEEGELVERSSITKTDYVNVTDVANVKLLPLGTDNFGRDVLKELVSATGTSIVIGLTSWTWTARSVRSQVISLRNRDHVNLSKLSGHSLVRIILTDILPYIASYVVMSFILQVSSGILAEAQLSLLGLGPKTTVTPTLGLMMNWAMLYSAHTNGSWWAYFPVILTITLISFSLNLMNTGLDQVFNPTLRD